MRDLEWGACGCAPISKIYRPAAGSERPIETGRRKGWDWG